IRPGSLLEKVLERSTAQSLQRVGNAKLVKTLETTNVIETRIDRYTALLFTADVVNIAADSSQQQKERKAKNTKQLKEIVETKENKKKVELKEELKKYEAGKEQVITEKNQKYTAQNQDIKE
ncbi:13114_t:CDS:2, partial [Cetraspora pellucida]